VRKHKRFRGCRVKRLCVHSTFRTFARKLPSIELYSRQAKYYITLGKYVNDTELIQRGVIHRGEMAQTAIAEVLALNAHIK